MSAPYRIPSTKELRAFEAVARLGSFKLAAEELNVTASALTRRIQSLEEELGQVLFIRDIRGIRLTEPGQRYAESLKGIFKLLADATDGVRAHRPRTLCVVAPSVTAKKLLIDLPQFEAAHPQVQLEIHSSLGLANNDPLLEKADIAYLFGQGPFEGWWCRQMFPKAFSYPVCAPNYLSNGMVDDPTLLARYTWIKVCHFEDAWERWYSAQGLPTPNPVRVLTVNNGVMAYEAAQNGLGMMISGTYPGGVDRWVESGSLVLAHPFHAFLGTFGYYVATRPEKLEDPAVKAFLEWDRSRFPSPA